MSGKRWFCVPCPGSFKPAHQVLCPPLLHNSPYVDGHGASRHLMIGYQQFTHIRGFWKKSKKGDFEQKDALKCSSVVVWPVTLKSLCNCAMLDIKWPAQRVMGDLALLWIQYCRRNQRLWCRLDRHIWLGPLLVYWPSSPPSQAHCYVIYITYGRDSLLANHLHHH